MEPNKFETQFREKLNSREIKPSRMAWNKLDAMLSVSEKPKRKNFTWIYFAASFVGFLLIGTAYFSQTERNIEKQRNAVVNQDRIIPKTIVDPTIVVNTKREERKSLVTNVVQKAALKSSRKPKLIEQSIVVKNNQNQVAEVSISNQKIEQKSIKPQTNTVSVDELMAAVENPSKKENHLNPKPVVHVNASNLLSQVDGELELSFREKVINKVSKNYQTVKVALANRNLE
jgi:hypothetical protein